MVWVLHISSQTTWQITTAQDIGVNSPVNYGRWARWTLLPPYIQEREPTDTHEPD